ncbi:uncharacterized protein LOC129595602 [Paramacrobiotus metropolitanus]|uniref:uncharacterized protein LOC129595602 n=1 Tax=Paramacrobiotus metropolitanus TaxID=2943436 RepID=UPI002446252A|nr:uncharacterized protein LOC129595602 [Paramacrobiotus metropolitanus]XP_055348634.1 uncharacterized protein LOC129595602 [Paramacrobiotus metropolitanus]
MSMESCSGVQIRPLDEWPLQNTTHPLHGLLSVALLLPLVKTIITPPRLLADQTEFKRGFNFILWEDKVFDVTNWENITNVTKSVDSTRALSLAVVTENESNITRANGAAKLFADNLMKCGSYKGQIYRPNDTTVVAAFINKDYLDNLNKTLLQNFVPKTSGVPVIAAVTSSVQDATTDTTTFANTTNAPTPIQTSTTQSSLATTTTRELVTSAPSTSRTDVSSTVSPHSTRNPTTPQNIIRTSSPSHFGPPADNGLSIGIMVLISIGIILQLGLIALCAMFVIGRRKRSTRIKERKQRSHSFFDPSDAVSYNRWDDVVEERPFIAD